MKKDFNNSRTISGIVKASLIIDGDSCSDIVDCNVVP